MKTRATLLLLLSLPLLSHANGSQDVSELLKQRIENSSNELGLSTEKYLNAAHIFERLMDNIPENDDFEISSISTFPEYQEGLQYAELGLDLPKALDDKITKLKNNQKMILATGLGIDVSILDQFLNIVSQHGSMNNSNVDNMTASADGGTKPTTEIIRVQCSSDYCNKGSWGNYSLALVLHTEASRAGVKQYEPFEVVFEKADTNQVIKKEVWKYNDFSGAWREKTLPCSDCQVDY